MSSRSLRPPSELKWHYSFILLNLTISCGIVQKGDIKFDCYCPLGKRIGKGRRFQSTHGQLRASQTGKTLSLIPDLAHSAVVTGTVIRSEGSGRWVVAVDQWPDAGEVYGVPAPTAAPVLVIIDDEAPTIPPTTPTTPDAPAAITVTVNPDVDKPEVPTAADFQDAEANMAAGSDGEDEKLLTSRSIGVVPYAASTKQSPDDSENASKGFLGIGKKPPHVHRLGPADSAPTNPSWMEGEEQYRIDPVSGRKVDISGSDFAGEPTDAWGDVPTVRDWLTSAKLHDYDWYWMKFDRPEWWTHLAVEWERYADQCGFGLGASGVHAIAPPAPWEMARFIGIHRLDAALGRTGNILDRWDYTKHGTFNCHIAAALPLRRFLDIKRGFHLVNNETLAEPKFRPSPSDPTKMIRNPKYYAKQKLMPAEKQYNEMAAHLYTAPPHIFVDEYMIPAHHRSKLINAGKGKSTKGIRVDELGASFGRRFITHVRIHDPREPKVGHGVGMNGFAAILYEMLKAMHDAGYSGIWFMGDNLYCTPRIFHKISKDLGYRGCGTWRPNYGVWEGLTMKGSSQVKESRSATGTGGAAKWSRNVAFENELTYAAIVESGEFYMLFNQYESLEFTDYKRQVTKYDDYGVFNGYETVTDQKTMPQVYYNTHKVGVDQFNQILKMLCPRTLARRFTLPAYLGLDGVKCVGLHSIHEWFAESIGEQAASRREFQQKLGEAICRYHPSLYPGDPGHDDMGRDRPVPRRWPLFKTWLQKHIYVLSAMAPMPVIDAPPAALSPLAVGPRPAKRRKTMNPAGIGCKGHTLVLAARCHITPKTLKGPNKGKAVRSLGNALCLPVPTATCHVCKTAGQRYICPVCGVGYCDPNSRRLSSIGGARQCFWEATATSLDGEQVLIHTSETAKLNR